jgi:hypothetical protein
MQRYRDIAVIILCLVLAACAYFITESLDRLLLASTELTYATKQSEQNVANAAIIQIGDIGPRASAALKKVSAVADSASGAIKVTAGHLNAPCEPAPCGTLADFNRTRQLAVL